MLTAVLGDVVDPKARRAIGFALSRFGRFGDPTTWIRSVELLAWADELGASHPMDWGVVAVAKARKQGGLWIPRFNVGFCNEWFYEGIRLGLVTERPVPGAVVLYTNRSIVLDGRYAGQLDAVHLGLVVAVRPTLISIEAVPRGDWQGENPCPHAVVAVDRSQVLCFVQTEPSNERRAA